MDFKQASDIINSNFQVTIYGMYRDADGQVCNVIKHHFWEREDWISTKLEFGRRFKDIVVYKIDGETKEDMQQRFADAFEAWLNSTKDTY